MLLIKLPDDFCSDLYSKYETAMDAKNLVFNGEFATHNRLEREIDGKAYEFELTLLKSLQQRPEVGNVNDNPFAKPEPELTVLPSFGSKDEFRIVFNKFPVVPGHFMLITKDFKPQTTPLSPNELVATISILKKLKESDLGKKWFAFYNSGPESGASQPHKHIQFMTLPDGFAPFADNLANGSDAFIPNQMREPLQDKHLPFAHYVARLPDNSDEITEELLAMTYLSLLQRTLTVLKENESSQISYNFCATTKYMMLIPRSSGKYEDIMGINSCGFMGLFLCKNDELFDMVKENGPENILKSIGFPNTSERPSADYHY